MWIYACNYQFPVKCADGCLRVIYMKIEFPTSEHPPGSTTVQRQPWYVHEFALERFQTLEINWKFRFVCVWRAVSKCFCIRTRHRDESLAGNFDLTKAHTTVFIIRRINGFAWAEPTDETTRGTSDVLFRTGSWYMVWAATDLSVHHDSMDSFWRFSTLKAMKIFLSKKWNFQIFLRSCQSSHRISSESLFKNSSLLSNYIKSSPQPATFTPTPNEWKEETFQFRKT